MTTADAGVLYVVATPIGNLEDLSPRARRVLAEVALVAAEDTRHSGKLLAHFGIHTPLLSMHDHNEAERVPALIEKLLAGESLALVSDAGTPLISDPGFDLVRAARAAGITVTPVPGPSALIAALSVSGLPTDRFVFEGFLPAKAGARRGRLGELARETRTLVLYEAVHRLADTLQDMRAAFGKARAGAVARELTKLHETVRTGSLQELADWAEQDATAMLGEVVLLVAGAEVVESGAVVVGPEQLLGALLDELPLKQAVALAARISGGGKNTFYEMALKINAGH